MFQTRIIWVIWVTSAMSPHLTTFKYLTKENSNLDFLAAFSTLPLSKKVIIWHPDLASMELKFSSWQSLFQNICIIFLCRNVWKMCAYMEVAHIYIRYAHIQKICATSVYAQLLHMHKFHICTYTKAVHNFNLRICATLLLQP